MAAALLLMQTVPRDACAMDLLSAYLLAQDSDPAFAAARHALDAGLQRMPQARAALHPSVSLHANGNRQDGQVSFAQMPYLRRHVDGWTWSLQLSQPLVRVAQWIAVGIAGAQVAQAHAHLAQAESDLIVRTAQAYFDLLAARDSVVVAIAQLKSVAQQRLLAKRRYDAGETTISDVHESQARHDLGQSHVVQARNEEKSREAELERLIGSVSGSLAPLKADAALPHPAPPEADEWIAQAREHNPAVRIQAAALDIAEKEVSRHRAGHLPTLDLTAGYGWNHASGSLTSPADIPNRSRSGTIGLQLTIPLYQGGAVDSRVTEALASQNRSRAELEGARRLAAAQARQAFGGVTSGLSQVEALSSAVASSSDAVEANRIGYRIGTRVNIDVLNADQQLFAAKRDLARARYDVILQGLRLKAAAGSLAGPDVIAVNRLLGDASGVPVPP